MKTYALLLGLSFLLAVLLTPAVRAIAQRFGWLEQPDERRVHTLPTPPLGGVAIFISFVLALVPLFFIHNRITTQLRIEWPSLEALPPAIFVIFLLGLVDDLFNLSPYIKLAVEIGCASWVFFHGTFVGPVSNPTGKAFDIGMWSLPLTVLWLVGLTNAFNLVDGIDGLAAGIAVFAMATLVLVSLLTSSTLLIAFLAALGGATAGFLLYNFHPASIFLGDSGALFLGFTLGTLCLVWGQKSPLVVAVVGPILIFGLPIVDTALAVVRRFFGGAPIMVADREHIHHRLLSLGLSPRKVVLILYGACFVFGLATLFLVNAQRGVAFFLLAGILAAAWLVLSHLGYHEIAEINLTVRRGLLDQTSIIKQRVQFRKAAVSLSEASDLDDLWARLITVAQTFDFHHVELSLDTEPASPAPMEIGARASLPGQASRSAEKQESTGRTPASRRYWSDGAETVFNAHPERFWKIELPLRTESGKPGYVAFSRALDKEELHFRIETFVEQLAVNIAKSLAKTGAGNKNSKQPLPTS